MSSSTRIYHKYIQQYDELIGLVNESNKRIVKDEPDDLFMDHINLFSKSFMVLSVTYLESYLKEVCLLIVNYMNKKLLENPLPHNLINWSILQGKHKDIQFKGFALNISSKDIDDGLSGNVHKTITLFSNLGIDLQSIDEFCNNKDKIANIVTKRNDIVHHNDEASDISFSDIISNIKVIKDYILTIDNEIITYTSNKSI
ncbi:hypothetical protein IFR10_15555 [Bacillus sp. CFBP 13597]|uniref:HEPN domain-containing protein n=1 Tax=Peribacillus frigoritolerans TaxID=450367 RepID=UPI0017807D54|nr:hypothetical protein [Bacillus sp. CFBP 13597]